MCGIGGVLKLNNESTWNEEEARQTAIKIIDSLSHRGPDGNGYMCQKNLLITHNSLSIIDTSGNGAQPMQIGSSGPIISFNGEIYNYRELKQELISSGLVDWKSNTDTEVILNVYLKWGIEGLKKLEGIFAYALWDSRYDRLLLIRDRLGVKPIYYHVSSDKIAFASEIKGILAANSNFPKKINSQSISEYMWFGNIYENRTIYANVYTLQPGEMLICENKNIKIQKWWSIEDNLNSNDSREDLNLSSEKLKILIDKAVKRQTFSDVGVGLFLSGGVDSSTLAASLSFQSCANIECYTAKFGNDIKNEEYKIASSTAKSLGLKHNTVEINDLNLQEIVYEMALSHDEPFADAANIPLYVLSKNLPNSVKVILQGDGGDELFAGYRRYFLLKYENLAKLMPINILKLIAKSSRSLNRLIRIINALSNEDAALKMGLLTTTETFQSPPESLFNKDYTIELQDKVDPFKAYRTAYGRFKHYDSVQMMMLTDLTTQLPSQYLTKVDRATMYASKESRVPLLDESIIDFAINMPVNYKLYRGENKFILKNSQKSRLSKNLLYAPKKGFGVPIQRWLTTELSTIAKDSVLSSSFLNKFDLDRSRVSKLFLDNEVGKVDNSFMLWKLMQLSIWNSSVRQ